MHLTLQEVCGPKYSTSKDSKIVSSASLIFYFISNCVYIPCFIFSLNVGDNIKTILNIRMPPTSHNLAQNCHTYCGNKNDQFYL